jgi:hypothetical protein
LRIPLNGDQMSGPTTNMDRRDTSNGSVHKGGGPGDRPCPLWNPALSVRVTTGSHTVPIPTKEKRTDGSLEWWVPRPPVQALVLDIQTKEPWVELRSTGSSSFWIVQPTSVIPFSPGLRSNNKVSVWGTLGQPLK